MRKDVLRNFTKSQNPQENTCDRVSFSIIKKGTLAPVNFAKFLRTPFLQNISGRLLLYLKYFHKKVSCQPR